MAIKSWLAPGLIDRLPSPSANIPSPGIAETIPSKILKSSQVPGPLSARASAFYVVMQTIGQHLDVPAHVAELKHVTRGPHAKEVHTCHLVYGAKSISSFLACALTRQRQRDWLRLLTGNIEINPQIGILLIDFDTGDTTLKLTGTGSVLWDERNLPGVSCLTS